MDGRLVFLPAVVGRILVRWKCKKGRHHRSHRRASFPEAMPIGVSFSAAHRLAVLPMCQPLICHRALVTMSQSLDSAPSRLCRKSGRSAASVPPACPFPFPVQQPHARISGQPPSWETVFILFCTAVSLLAAPTRPSAPFSFCPPIRPHLPVTSPVPAVPFRGGKRWCGAKKSVSCSRYCRPGSSIPQLRSLPPSSKLFSKKSVKKFARKEKGYTFAAANEVKRSNPSGLEKRRRGH